jgi:hypothetical protein
MTSSLNIQEHKNQIQRILFHLRLRYIGFPLLVCGLLILITALLSHHIEWYWKIGSVVSCGLSLASFGSNHDTAIAYATTLPHQKLKNVIQSETEQLEPRLQKSLSYILAELEDENSWKKTTADNIEAHPYIASIIPLVTISLQIFIFLHL